MARHRISATATIDAPPAVLAATKRCASAAFRSRAAAANAASNAMRVAGSGSNTTMPRSPSTSAAVRAAGDADLIVADGTSCRHQIRDLSGREAVHSVRVLDQALG